VEEFMSAVWWLLLLLLLLLLLQVEVVTKEAA
jgi:hypothetical protein